MVLKRPIFNSDRLRKYTGKPIDKDNNKLPIITCIITTHSCLGTVEPYLLSVPFLKGKCIGGIAGIIFLKKDIIDKVELTR